ISRPLFIHQPTSTRRKNMRQWRWLTPMVERKNRFPDCMHGVLPNQGTLQLLPMRRTREQAVGCPAMLTSQQTGLKIFAEWPITLPNLRELMPIVWAFWVFVEVVAIRWLPLKPTNDSKRWQH